jgi:hypothetical protein
MEDAFCSLRDPEGQDIPFTRKGETHFQQVAIRGLEAMGAAGRRHHLPAVIDALKAEFMSSYTHGTQITDENAHDVFDLAISKAENRFAGLAHHIPCSVVVHQEPNRFQIGPVHFVRRELFFKENEVALRNAQEPAGDVKWAFEELHNFFGRFLWVASVTIDRAHKEVSRSRAREIVQMALDMLKLVVGSERGSGIRQGYDYAMPRSTSDLVSTEDGDFLPSWRGRMQDAILRDNWYEMISRWELWKTAESIFVTYADAWEPPPELHRRFLDALRWHGEGISDAHADSRFAKYWISIERLVSLKANDEVTRKAALLSCSGPEHFSARFKKCQRLYGKRSALVHGRTDMDAEESEGLAAETENLSQIVLFSYLRLLRILQEKNRFDHEGLEREFALINENMSRGLTTP